MSIIDKAFPLRTLKKRDFSKKNLKLAIKAMDKFIEIPTSDLKIQCGSATLRKEGNDAVCRVCGQRISNYKKLRLEMGDVEFKKFEKGIK